ncbi:MAG: hypothetical protein V4714_06665 [Bacteroidota bacterium]
MRNIIGVPATEGDFYNRPQIIRSITEGLSRSSNILLTAPRRVGKTSVMMYLLHNSQEPYFFLYKDVEGISTSNGFFKEILYSILKDKQIAQSPSVAERIKSLPGKFFKSIKALNIGLEGASIEFQDNHEQQEHNYLEELQMLLSRLDLGGKKIIMMLDEFPWAIENIVKKSNLEEASRFLQANRSLRLTPEFQQKIQFIYAGSIGLNATVSRLGISASVNDLHPINVSPLSQEEAKDMIQQIAATESITITNIAIQHLLEKIGWLIPFYIQLAIKEAKDLLPDNREIDEHLMNKAFDQIIEYRNNNLFHHWKSRLDTSFVKNELKFVHVVLSYMAQNETMHYHNIHNLAVKHKVAEPKQVLETLKYDGYVNNQEDKQVYRYNSPILKLWWQRYVCK